MNFLHSTLEFFAQFGDYHMWGAQDAMILQVERVRRTSKE